MSKKTPVELTALSCERQIEQFFGRTGLLSSQFAQYEERTSQIDMAKLVMMAMMRNEKLMIEAGTGTGKTFAYLVPALLSGKKVVLSTGTKTLQDQIFFKDLPVLRKIFHQPIKAVLMKGKENYLCLYRFAGFSLNPLLFSRDEAPFIDQIKAWAKGTVYGERSELSGLPEKFPAWKEMSVTGNQCHGKSCTYYDDCYITRMKKEMEDSQLIVVNHHLFFADLALRENSFGQILSDYDQVIFDEAHLIEEIASSYFGIQFSLYDLFELVADARRELKTLQINNKQLWENLDHLIKSADLFFNLFVPVSGEKRIRLSRLPETSPKVQEAVSFLNSLQWVGAAFQNFPKKSEGCYKISDRAIQLQEYGRIFLRQQSPEEIYWGELRNPDSGDWSATPRMILHATPIEIASRLQENLFNRKAGMILTSATLTVENTFDHMKKKIGIIPDREIQFQSPFDYSSRGLIYLPPGMPDPSSDAFARSAAEEILQILQLTSGRAFILCTSHKNKEFYYDYCRDKLDFPLLKQGDGQKRELLDTFRNEISSVLFATQSFWQGVDVQGEALSCVIIDKLPFASPSDPIVEARIHDFQKKNINAFQEYQIPSAIILLKQGLGRLIRSAEDRGLFSILDPRIRTKSYGKRFLASLPSCRVTNKRSEIQDFFKSH
ncbi:MAG: ATP-dependent DNA helicase [Nitrospirae bacterium]|nr:ATP-dependent DNA helicase [Nitrospirota bacterium]